MGSEMSATDGDGFVDDPAFARTRSMVSLAARPAAALEDGDGHVSGSLSSGDGFEPDARAGNRVVALPPEECRLQRVYGRTPDVGGHADRDAIPAWLVALRESCFRR